MTCFEKLLLPLLLMLGSGTAAGQEVVEYIHTDALGSPVAASNASGVVIERTLYEPYGATIGAGPLDGPGFAGQVSDSSTGLSYMHQRYLDPQLASFLSVDPVTAYEQPVGQFNRYRYADGNPYTFTDPNGGDAIYFTDVNVVVIPVYFTGVGATTGNLQAIKSRVDSIRSEFAGMKFRLQVLSAPGGKGTNTMELGMGPNYINYPRAGEGVNRFGGSRGYIDMSAEEAIGAVAHDILHFAGALEGYDDSNSRENRMATYRSGYLSKHIMADRRGDTLRAIDEDAIKENPTTYRHRLSSFQGVYRVNGRIESIKLRKELEGK